MWVFFRVVSFNVPQRFTSGSLYTSIVIHEGIVVYWGSESEIRATSYGVTVRVARTSKSKRLISQQIKLTHFCKNCFSSIPLCESCTFFRNSNYTKLIFSQSSFTNYVSTISQIFSLSCHQFLGRECPYFLNFSVSMNFKLFAELPFFKKNSFSLHVLVKLGKNPACRSPVLQKNIQLTNARKN